MPKSPTKRKIVMSAQKAARDRNKPKSYDDEFWFEPQRTITVIEDDETIDTGLVDVDGNSIYRVLQKVPIGYRLK